MTGWILTKPVWQDEQEIGRFVQECKDAGNFPVQGANNMGEKEFGEWLGHIARYDRGEDLPEGHVPSSCFLLKDGETPRIYGVVSIRWRLTEALRNAAGNIGYSIRPSEYKKGYGSMQLSLAIEKCRERGMDSALVTCHSTNRASAATILSQGGVEDESYCAPDGTVFRRFWIPTGERLVLRRPAAQDQQAVGQMIAEFAGAGEDFICGASGVNRLPWAKWMEKIEQSARGERPGKVPQHTYLGVLAPSGSIVGFAAVRPQLNAELENVAGNIGYSIRPSERRKGYGGAQLSAALRNIAQYGLESALLTCDRDNTASAATILSQGGVEIEPYVETNGSVQRRFRIALCKR